MSVLSFVQASINGVLKCFRYNLLFMKKKKKKKKKEIKRMYMLEFIRNEFLILNTCIHKLFSFFFNTRSIIYKEHNYCQKKL